MGTEKMDDFTPNPKENQHKMVRGETLSLEVEKIWVTEWLIVKKHSRVSYLRLRDEDVALYDIRAGDKIRVQLQVIKKLPREEPEEKENE